MLTIGLLLFPQNSWVCSRWFLVFLSGDFHYVSFVGGRFHESRKRKWSYHCLDDDLAVRNPWESYYSMMWVYLELPCHFFGSQKSVGTCWDQSQISCHCRPQCPQWSHNKLSTGRRETWSWDWRIEMSQAHATRYIVLLPQNLTFKPNPNLCGNNNNNSNNSNSNKNKKQK